MPLKNSLHAFSGEVRVTAMAYTEPSSMAVATLILSSGAKMDAATSMITGMSGATA